jgi:hypothetical protein
MIRLLREQPRSGDDAIASMAAGLLIRRICPSRQSLRPPRPEASS